MTGRSRSLTSAGLCGPVALFGGLLLLLVSPLMRGGNRYGALIPLELIGLLILTAVWARLVLDGHLGRPPRSNHSPLVTLLVFSPLLLALIYLTPLPASWWFSLPGHAIYAQTLSGIGASVSAARPVSVSPDATAASLLAGIPIIAALLLGYFAALRQLQLLLRLVVVVAVCEVIFGLLQISGGQYSPLFFGVMTYGPPVGTFANRNHFANYIAMALAAHVWLGYEAIHAAKSGEGNTHRALGTFTSRHAMALRVAIGLVLVLGILMSRSRGGALFGLPVAALGLAAAALRINGWARGWRFAVPITLLLLLGAAAMVGFDAVTSRITGDQLASSANFRNALARTSLEGAMVFWPFGSGWGTYDLAYQQFQPPSIPFYPNYAHQDYIQMLFEGGIFFVALAAVFVWLAGQRAWLLSRNALRGRKLDGDAMAAALCGLGLLGFLLHSLVEFNMRIPANAIVAALLAGVYLRPLSLPLRNHARSSQPHFSRH